MTDPLRLDLHLVSAHVRAVRGTLKDHDPGAVWDALTDADHAINHALEVLALHQYGATP